MILIQDALRAIPNNSEGKYIKIIHVTAKYWSKIYNPLFVSHFGFICRLKSQTFIALHNYYYYYGATVERFLEAFNVKN